MLLARISCFAVGQTAKVAGMIDPIRLLRMTGIAEGISYLLLLGIAMPLKYLADIPEPVTYVGWAHGILFIALMGAIAWTKLHGLTWKLATLAAIASLLPFGPFLIDGKLKRAEIPTSKKA
jgi:integral membrane protein